MLNRQYFLECPLELEVNFQGNGKTEVDERKQVVREGYCDIPISTYLSDYQQEKNFQYSKDFTSS